MCFVHVAVSEAQHNPVRSKFRKFLVKTGTRFLDRLG